jgi:hypothetical protein
VTTICAVLVNLPKTEAKNFSDILLEEYNFMGISDMKFGHLNTTQQLNDNIRISDTKKSVNDKIKGKIHVDPIS